MRAFLRSFRYAARGLVLCLHERNFRVHLVISAYMYACLAVPGWFVLTHGQWAVLIATNALVLAAEAFNTAIEAVVDLACPDIHPLAARAKDIAAGKMPGKWHHSIEEAREHLDI